MKRWYLSVVDELARSKLVWTCFIEGLQWAEVDCHADLEQAERMIKGWAPDRDGVEEAIRDWPCSASAP